MTATTAADRGERLPHRMPDPEPAGPYRLLRCDEVGNVEGEVAKDFATSQEALAYAIAGRAGSGFFGAAPESKFNLMSRPHSVERVVEYRKMG